MLNLFQHLTGQAYFMQYSLAHGMPKQVRQTILLIHFNDLNIPCRQLQS
jgi:hypothetical protein